MNAYHACSGSACLQGVCESGLPPDPGGPAGDGAGSVAFAFSKFFLGDADRGGTQSSTAWKQYGLNLDGKITTASSTDVCAIAAGASKTTRVDGLNGIDNSFGENILPLFLTTGGSDMATKQNAALNAGASTMLLRIDRLGTQPSYSPLGGAVFGGAPLGSAPASTGSDTWPVDTSSVNGGDVTSPKASFTSGYMNNRVWVSGALSGRITLPLAFGGDALVIPLDHAVVTMLVDAGNQSANNGVLAGVIPTEEFILAFQQVAGRISTSLCSGSAFNSVAQQIRQASDILLDGTNQPGAPCNAISFGMGFEAKRVQLGSVVTPQPLSDPCH